MPFSPEVLSYDDLRREAMDEHTLQSPLDTIHHSRGESVRIFVPPDDHWKNAVV